MARAYKFCPQCGTRNPVQAKFCQSCGAPFPSPRPPRRGRGIALPQAGIGPLGTWVYVLGAGILILLFLLVFMRLLVPGEPEIVRLVPDGVDTVYSVSVQELINSQGVATMYREVARLSDEPVTDLDAALDRLAEDQDFGIDLRDVGEVVIFADLLKTLTSSFSGGGSEYVGMILQAQLDEQLLENLLEPYTSETYGGHTIFFTSDDSFNAYTVLKDGVIVMGSRNAVLDVIDVYNGDADAWGGKMRKVYRSLGDAPIKGVTQMPTGIMQLLQGILGLYDEDLMKALEPLKDLEYITFEARERRRRFVFTYTLHFSSKDAAKAIGTIYRDLSRIAEALPGVSSPVDVSSRSQGILMKNLKVDVGGSTFSVIVDLSPRELAEVLVGLD